MISDCIGEAVEKGAGLYVIKTIYGAPASPSFGLFLVFMSIVCWVANFRMERAA